MASRPSVSGRRDEDDPVKTPRTAEGRVQVPGDVGCADDQHSIVVVVDAVQFLPGTG